MDQRFLRRGEQFSAGYRREQFEKTLQAGTDYSLPRNQRIEDEVDFGSVSAPTLVTPIPPDNKGYMLLQKMGWKTGTGLGKAESGLTAPVGTEVMDSGNRMGLGRMQLEHDLLAAETATRRQLSVEEQMNEDMQTTQSRLQRAEEREKVEAHVQEIKKSFFCEDCSKQYNSIAELEEHLSSYDHHHRKRLADLKKMEHERTREQRSKKESKRQAKEAARLEKQIAAARGMKGTGTVGAPRTGPSVPAARPPAGPPLPPSQPLPGAPPLPSPAQPPLPPEPCPSGSHWHNGYTTAGSRGSLNAPAQHQWRSQPPPAPSLPPETSGGSLSFGGFSLAPTGSPHGYVAAVDVRPACPPLPPSNVEAGLSLSLGGQSHSKGAQFAFAFGNQAKPASASKPKASLSMFSAGENE